MSRKTVVSLVLLACAVAFAWSLLAQGAFTKTYVADRIRKVEDGLDEFRKWAEKRGEDAKGRAESAQSSGKTSRRTRTADSVEHPSTNGPGQKHKRRSQ